MGMTEFNRLFYDKNWTILTDFIKYNPGARHRRRIISYLVSKIQPKTCCDVGCGMGDLLLKLHQDDSDCDYKGVDLSEETIIKNALRMPNFRFEQLDISQKPSVETYDLVICSEVIEHIEQREQAIMNLCKMVNAEHGKLLLTFPVGKVYLTEKHFGHTVHPTMEEVTAAIKKSNMQVELWFRWGWPVYDGVKYLTNINPEWALKTFATGSYGIISKIINHILYGLNYFSGKSQRLGCQIYLVARHKK